MRGCTEIHDLTFRMKGKKPEKVLLKMIKSNVKPSLVTLIFAIKVDNRSELKAKCIRVEKVLREKRQKSRQVNEVGWSEKTSKPTKMSE